MKDTKGARQQSSFKHNNWRRMHYKRIIYNDMVMSYDFTKTRLSQEEEEDIVKKTVCLFYYRFLPMIKKFPNQDKFALTRTLKNGKQFIVVCFND